MFSLVQTDANDPQGLMRRKEPNKQTNKNFHSLKSIFPLFTTACIEVVTVRMTNKVIYLIDQTIALISAQLIHCCK